MTTYVSRLHRIILVATAFLVVIALLTPIAHAASTVTRGYDSDDPIREGMLVSISRESDATVEPTTLSSINNLFGVSINQETTPLSISSGDTQVQVATSGVVDVFVSDSNGQVREGDPITVSNIAGIGAKAVSNIKIIGIAQANAVNQSQQELSDGSTANIAQVPVAIGVAYHYAEAKKTLIPGALQELANSVAGRDVAPAPIIVSGVIFVITLIIVASLTFSMVRSSIISVGRNPLAQSAVYRDVIQLSVLVLGIITAAVVAIYLILRNL